MYKRQGVPRADGHRTSASHRYERGRDGLGILGEPGQLGAEHHVTAQLAEPVEQDPLGAPLGQDPGPGIGRVLGRLGVVEHPVLARAGASLPRHADRRVAAPPHDLLEDAEVVEDLQGPRLDPLAPGTGEQLRRPLDDERAHAAPGEVAGQHQAGGPGAHDQDIAPPVPQGPGRDPQGGAPLLLLLVLVLVPVLVLVLRHRSPHSRSEISLTTLRRPVSQECP